MSAFLMQVLQWLKIRILKSMKILIISVCFSPNEKKKKNQALFPTTEIHSGSPSVTGCFKGISVYS